MKDQEPPPAHHDGDGDMVAFGRGPQPGSGGQPYLSGRDEHCTPDVEPERHQSWWHRLVAQQPVRDQPVWINRALVAVTVVALLIAIAAWASRDGETETTATLPAVQSHGLTEDQAACFDVARIEGRVLAVLGSTSLLLDAAADTSIITALDAEIRLIDEVAANYPHADYRLIAAFSAAADTSAAVIKSRGFDTFPKAVDLRAERFTDVADLCRSLASFEMETLAPVED